MPTFSCQCRLISSDDWEGVPFGKRTESTEAFQAVAVFEEQERCSQVALEKSLEECHAFTQQMFKDIIEPGGSVERRQGKQPINLWEPSCH